MTQRDRSRPPPCFGTARQTEAPQVPSLRTGRGGLGEALPLVPDQLHELGAGLRIGLEDTPEGAGDGEAVLLLDAAHQACSTSGLTGCLSLQEGHRPVGQISPDKDVNFRYTAAAFTLSLESRASLCRANLPGDWALYAVSVRRLIALRSGFLQTPPHEDALAVG